MYGGKHSLVMEPVDASVWRGADSLRNGKALSQPNLNAWLIQEALFSVGCRPLDCIRV